MVASLLKNEQHDFACPEWMTVPFQVHHKAIFDHLVDILFSILQCLVLADRMIKSTTEKSNSRRIELHALVSRSMSQLDLWWLRYTATTDLGEMNAQLRLEASDNGSDEVPGGPNHFPILRHSNMPGAALTALYDAANVIVFRLLFLVSPSAYLYERRIQQHVQSILSAKEFITSSPRPTSGRGSIMVGLPLKIIKVWNPSLEIQDGDLGGFVATSNGFFADIATYILRYPNPRASERGPRGQAKEVS